MVCYSQLLHVFMFSAKSALELLTVGTGEFEEESSQFGRPPTKTRINLLTIIMILLLALVKNNTNNDTLSVNSSINDTTITVLPNSHIVIRNTHPFHKNVIVIFTQIKNI